MSDRAKQIERFLLDLQDEIIAAVEEEDGEARFDRRVLAGRNGSESRPAVLELGPVIEKAAVNFSSTVGERLPPAATDRRPELAGRSFRALSVSLIVHPRNPYAPTSHANLRFFEAHAEDAEPVWWFGGGFDLTPVYGFEEDCRHWHAIAKAACDPHGDGLYGDFKRRCDEYFFLPHRGEARGIGGLFFDDWSEGGFAASFALWKSIGRAFLPAYRPILARRKALDYGERERAFQLLRRGRYVEFNLAWDRGTRFGLQFGGRAESILASLPPRVEWRYDWSPEPGTPEAALTERFLPPRDWV